MYDEIYRASLEQAVHKLWIFSDLQQYDPAKARECMEVNLRDFRALGEPADMLWYLGDTVEGVEPDRLEDMCRMQEEAFASLGLPLCFVAGNHDIDYIRKAGGDRVFMYEMVKRHPEWHCAPEIDQPYFKVRLGRYTVYFLTDHVAKDLSWNTTHGIVHGQAEAYPHYALLENLKNEIAREEGPVITASHYAFAGGSRASALFNEHILPLPQNVKLHFYGHAHFGDFYWAGESPYKRISWVDLHDIPQINVSSFEHVRGLQCRSVFLHIYEDDSCGIFFRNHDAGVFTECYFPAKENFPYSERKARGL